MAATNRKGRKRLSEQPAAKTSGRKKKADISTSSPTGPLRRSHRQRGKSPPPPLPAEYVEAKPIKRRKTLQNSTFLPPSTAKAKPKTTKNGRGPRTSPTSQLDTVTVTENIQQGRITRCRSRQIPQTPIYPTKVRRVSQQTRRRPSPIPPPAPTVSQRLRRRQSRLLPTQPQDTAQNQRRRRIVRSQVGTGVDDLRDGKQTVEPRAGSTGKHVAVVNNRDNIQSGPRKSSKMKQGREEEAETKTSSIDTNARATPDDELLRDDLVEESVSIDTTHTFPIIESETTEIILHINEQTDCRFPGTDVSSVDNRKNVDARVAENTEADGTAIFSVVKSSPIPKARSSLVAENAEADGTAFPPVATSLPIPETISTLSNEITASVLTKSKKSPKASPSEKIRKAKNKTNVGATSSAKKYNKKQAQQKIFDGDLEIKQSSPADVYDENSSDRRKIVVLKRNLRNDQTKETAAAKNSGMAKFPRRKLLSTNSLTPKKQTSIKNDNLVAVQQTCEEARSQCDPEIGTVTPNRKRKGQHQTTSDKTSMLTDPESVLTWIDLRKIINHDVFCSSFNEDEQTTLLSLLPLFDVFPSSILGPNGSVDVNKPPMKVVATHPPFSAHRVPADVSETSESPNNETHMEQNDKILLGYDKTTIQNLFRHNFNLDDCILTFQNNLYLGGYTASYQQYLQTISQPVIEDQDTWKDINFEQYWGEKLAQRVRDGSRAIPERAVSRN